MEWLVVAEDVALLRRRQTLLVFSLEVEARHEDGERASDRIEVGQRRRRVVRLGGRVAARTIDVPGRIVDSPHGAHIDELHRVLLHHDVFGLEVAIDEAHFVEVFEGGEDLGDVGERLGDGQRAAALFAERHQRLAIDVFHHDEALVAVRDEIVDADDVRVLDGREVLALVHGHLEHARILRVEQALQGHPACEHRVEREVDPPEPAERDRPFDLVLAGDDVPFLQRRDERVFLAALGAEAGVPFQRRVARRAEALPLRDDAFDD